MVWLKRIREDHKKSQAEVAQESKIARGAYANIENGLRRPSVDAAKRIAAVLGFDWTWFYEDEPKQTSA